MKPSRAFRKVRTKELRSARQFLFEELQQVDTDTGKQFPDARAFRALVRILTEEIERRKACTGA